MNSNSNNVQTFSCNKLAFNIHIIHYLLSLYYFLYPELKDNISLLIFVALFIVVCSVLDVVATKLGIMMPPFVSCFSPRTSLRLKKICMPHHYLCTIDISP